MWAVLQPMRQLIVDCNSKGVPRILNGCMDGWMDGLPYRSKYQRTGTTGRMYMMFPQFPNKARVDSVQTGQNTSSTESAIGPNEFQTIP